MICIMLFKTVMLLRTKEKAVLSLKQFFKPGAGHRPARAWFLKIDPVRIVGMRACVCVCVCLRPRLSITSGVI